MTTDIIPTELNNNAFMTGLRKITDEKTSQMEKSIRLWIDLPKAAKWIDQCIVVTKGLGETTNESYNRIFKAQVERMNLPVVAEALKTWSGIYSSITDSLSRNHSTFVEKSLNGVADCVGSLGRSNGIEDMIPAYSAMMNDMKKDLESCFTETVETLNSLSSAVQIWMKKTLVAYEACDSDYVIKQAVSQKSEKDEP
jgi:hypothetical protein